MLRRHRPVTGVEQQETPGAVGVLGGADVVAGLSEDRGLLVAQRGGDGHPGELAHGGAVDLGGGPDLRENRLRDVHRLQDGRIPLEGLQVHQHRAPGVGHVGDVPSAVGAAGEVPDQPGVDGAEGDLAVLRAGAQPGHVVQQPGRLGPGEVAGQRQPRAVAEPVLPVGAAELRAQPGGPGVLPHDGVVHGLARGAVPQDRRLPLVGDAQRAEPARRPALASAPATTACTLDQISVASCSTQPGFGKIWRCSRWSTATIAPCWSKTMQRLEVVPWSIAATNLSVMTSPSSVLRDQNAALNTSPDSAPPMSGPTTGTHAYPQSEVPLRGSGAARARCAGPGHGPG